MNLVCVVIQLHWQVCSARCRPERLCCQHTKVGIDRVIDVDPLPMLARVAEMEEVFELRAGHALAVLDQCADFELPRAPRVLRLHGATLSCSKQR